MTMGCRSTKIFLRTLFEVCRITDWGVWFTEFSTCSTFFIFRRRFVWIEARPFLSSALLKSIPAGLHGSLPADSQIAIVAIKAQSRYHAVPLPPG